MPSYRRAFLAVLCGLPFHDHIRSISEISRKSAGEGAC
jgi:hypothetical protein